MNQNLLSICCLGYNHAKFIEANLSAIISSKCEQIEIIAVDDGSTDGSQEILKNIAKESRFPIQLLLQENSGNPALNFNRAIRLAKGEFITFISFDDVLNMGEIEQMLTEMRKNLKIAFMTSTNFNIIDSEGKITENRKLPVYTKKNSTVDEMLEFEYSKFESFWLQGTVFRREIINAVQGFDEDMLADDIVLRTKVLRYMAEHDELSFRLIDTPAFFYRLHGNNISGNTKRQIKSVTQYLDRYWGNRPNPQIYTEWVAYAVKVYDTPTVKSIFIPSDRLVQAMSDKDVEKNIVEKSFIPLYNELLAQKEEKINGMQARIDVLNQRLDSLYDSRSWRITKPLREAGHLVRKLLPKKILTALRILRKDGIKGLYLAIKKKWTQNKGMRAMKRAWNNRHGFVLSPEAFGISKKTIFAQKNTLFSHYIKFSILVPLYNTPKNFLHEMIGSVLFQTYENWELCLADGSDDEHSYVQTICEKIARRDGRIKYKKLEKNGGISENTNECIKMVTGDYISLFDHDDLLHPSALFETMKAICEKDADFVYTDEAIFESPNLYKITFTNFKPDFAPEYFKSLNYICHFSSFKKTILDQIGGFDSTTDGAQDFDLFLRIFEKTKKIVHVQKCLYYWRSSPESTACAASAKSYTTEAGKLALKKHIKHCGIDANVVYGKVPNSYKINYKINDEPLVSILIPNYDHSKTLQTCLDSIRNLSTYQNYEIVIIENNSKKKETFDYYETLKDDDRIKILTWKGHFNYSAINNFGFKYTKGEYILLLNNDIEVISPNWIEEMLMFAQRKDVGAVGAMLYYPSDKIQHGGVILGIGGVAGHSHKYYPRNSYGYASRLCSVQNYSAITAACCMIPRHVFEEIKGLDESFEVAFNDIDMCMRIRKAGYLIVWTPYAELYHHESESRGGEDTPEKEARFAGEIRRFKEKWGKELSDGDPYYNPNLTLEREDFSVKGEIFPSEEEK